MSEAAPYQTELAEMKDDLAKTRYATFLIIPLKYEAGRLDVGKLEQFAQRLPVDTSDISEAVKDCLNYGAGTPILRRWLIPRDALIGQLFGQSSPCQLFVRDGAEGGTPFPFALDHAWLYVFHTEVAFLCLGLAYTDITTLSTITNLGFADDIAAYSFDREGRETFSLEEKLTAFLDGLHIQPFFATSPLFLESTIFNLAVVPRQFQYLDSLRHLTFNLHQTLPLGSEVEDDSEDDICYSYAPKNRDTHTHRWGCCVTSQTVNYVVANADMDLRSEIDDQAKDGLPVVLLALYEKYSCLRFTELLTHVDKHSAKTLKRLNHKMLEFRAYGTVHPSHLSRWYNVKQIYRYLIEINGIEVAIEDIRDKLGILAEHQKELESNISDAVMGLITVFGVVSILASLLSIMEILSGGDPTAWMITIVSTLFLIIGSVIVVFWQRKQ